MTPGALFPSFSFPQVRDVDVVNVLGIYDVWVIDLLSYNVTCLLYTAFACIILSKVEFVHKMTKVAPSSILRAWLIGSLVLLFISAECCVLAHIFTVRQAWTYSPLLFVCAFTLLNCLIYFDYYAYRVRKIITRVRTDLIELNVIQELPSISSIRPPSANSEKRASTSLVSNQTGSRDELSQALDKVSRLQKYVHPIAIVLIVFAPYIAVQTILDNALNTQNDGSTFQPSLFLFVFLQLAAMLILVWYSWLSPRTVENLEERFEASSNGHDSSKRDSLKHTSVTGLTPKEDV